MSAGISAGVSAGTSEIIPGVQAANTSARTPNTSPRAQDDSNVIPIALCNWQRAGPVIQALLRQAVGPEGEPVFVHVTFTTVDLLNWKHNVGLYRENSAEMHRLLETIVNLPTLGVNLRTTYWLYILVKYSLFVKSLCAAWALAKQPSSPCICLYFVY